MQDLNISQIEAILPKIKEMYSLIEEYRKFSNIGYGEDNGKSGLLSLVVVFQNIQAQAKNCYNYKEEVFVEQFNAGIKLIKNMCKHMNFHFSNYIIQELEYLLLSVDTFMEF